MNLCAIIFLSIIVVSFIILDRSTRTESRSDSIADSLERAEQGPNPELVAQIRQEKMRAQWQQITQELRAIASQAQEQVQVFYAPEPRWVLS